MKKEKNSKKEVKPQSSKAIDWIERVCRHPDSDPEFSGQPVRLMQWQKDIIKALYPDDRERTARHCLILTCKKTGKSSFASWLCLAMLKGFEKSPVRIGIVAPTLSQGENLFRLIETAAINSSVPVKRGGSSSSTRHLAFSERDKVFLLSGRETSKQGMQFPILIFEESAEIKQDSSHFTDLNDFCVNPLTIFLSNPPTQRNNFIRSFISRKADASYIKHCVKTPLSLSYKSEKTWRRANPSINEQPRLLQLYRRKIKEIAKNPAQIENFKRLFLGMHNFSDGSAWIDAALIRKVPQSIDLKSLKFYAGIDFSSHIDLTSLILSASYEDDKKILLSYNWIPRAAAERKIDRDLKTKRFFYDSGDCFLTAGKSVDPTQDVYDFMEKLEKKQGLSLEREVFIDRYKGHYEDKEGRFEPAAFIMSGNNLNPLVDRFEADALSGKILCSNPMFKWALGNVAMSDPTTSHCRHPVKKRSKESIDPVIAGLLSLENLRTKEADGGLPRVFNF